MSAKVKKTVTILIVNDDGDIRFLIRRALVTAIPEAIIIEAHSTKEALEARWAHSVDLIITDNRMPGGTGLEMIAQLRHTGSRVAIIVASCAAEIEKEAINTGADAFFSEASYSKLSAVALSLLVSSRDKGK